MNAAREEGKGAQQQASPSSLDKWEQGAKIFATVAIPIIVALGGWWIQATLEHDKEKAAKVQQDQQNAIDKDKISLEYVKIAKDILTSTATEIPAELITWSWRLLDGVSPVKFEKADLDRLIKHQERIPAPASARDFLSLGPEHEALFKNMKITDNERLKTALETIIANKQRYDLVEKTTGVPWFVVGIIHYRDANFNFDTYLGNGDPLSARTVTVPAGRGPFSTWEDGARDYLTFERLNLIKDWSISRALYEFERSNGFGYRSHGINSPYLWACASPYVKGYYASDGKFDPQEVAPKCGAAPLIKALMDRQLITLK